MERVMEVEQENKDEQVHTNEHRVFVHDIANDITIVDASLRKIGMLFSKSDMAEDSEEMLRLTKAQARTKDIILKLRKYREFLHHDI
jgi:hypothetical protein